MIIARRQTGISVVIIMFFIVLLSVMGTAMISVTVKDNLTVADEVKGQQAYYAAVSACDRATRDIATGVITSGCNYPSFNIGQAQITYLNVNQHYLSPPYILIPQSKLAWCIIAQARVGDTYRRMLMWRAVNNIAGSAGWPGVQPGGLAFRKQQIVFFNEDRNYR